MKKTLKKSLILALVGMLTLHADCGIIINNTKATGTPPSSPRKTSAADSSEFRGDTEEIYVLEERINQGNQSVSFKCKCKENGDVCVVKIPINDLPPSDDDQQKYHNEILKILKESFVPRHTDSRSMLSRSLPAQTSDTDSKLVSIPKTFVATAPPPTPMKKSGNKSRISGLPHPIHFNLDDLSSENFDDELFDELSFDDEEPLSSTRAPKKPNKLVSATDDSAHTASRSSKSSSSTGKMRIHRRLDFGDIVDDQDTSGKIGASESAHKRSHRTLSPIVKPDVCSMHLDVIDPRTIDALCSGKITGIVPIRSYRPHIEAFMPTTLKSIINTTLPKEMILTWTKEILDVLVQLNNHGLCHQDIKPDNIFINRSHALVGDLGLVCGFNQSASMCIGTPAYMAPEVWYKSTRTPDLCDRADVFSLGMTVLEMLTDFHATDIQCAHPMNPYFVYRNRNTAIVNDIDKYHLRGSSNPIPDNWKCFLKSCLVPDPAKRPTAEQAKTLLDKLFK